MPITRHPDPQQVARKFATRGPGLPLAVSERHAPALLAQVQEAMQINTPAPSAMPSGAMATPAVVQRRAVGQTASPHPADLTRPAAASAQRSVHANAATTPLRATPVRPARKTLGAKSPPLPLAKLRTPTRTADVRIQRLPPGDSPDEDDVQAIVPSSPPPLPPRRRSSAKSETTAESFVGSTASVSGPRATDSTPQTQPQSPVPSTRAPSSTPSTSTPSRTTARALAEIQENVSTSTLSDDVSDEDDDAPNLDLLARAVAPLIKRMMKRESERSGQ
jgi:hypothetical protein